MVHCKIEVVTEFDMICNQNLNMTEIEFIFDYSAYRKVKKVTMPVTSEGDPELPDIFDVVVHLEDKPNKLFAYGNI
uniref:Uncharacterized protein n=1 Tax=Onchocerca volvulus TaxID=6282 RepID=A0A8R1XX54_ONCVO